MSLDEVLNLTITTQDASPTRAGFGTPLLMACHNVIPDVVRVFASPQEFIDAGFVITDPAYRMAQSVFSQNPRPANVVLGKRTLAYTQTVELYPVKTTTGFHYQFTIVDITGVATPIDYVVLTGATVASICTALGALMSAITGVTGTIVSTKITLVATAGKLFNLTGLPLPANMKVKDVTTDPGIATDLAAVNTLDSTSWYAVTYDHAGKAEGLAAAAWIEAVRKIQILDSSDSNVLDPADATDIGSALLAASFVRSDTLFNQNTLLAYGAAAWLGKMLPTDPGAATWSFKNLAGVTVSKLTGGEKTAAFAKNVNTYTVLGGLAVTQWGKDAKGGYTDIVVGTDWLYARLQEGVFGALANAAKIPYTDSGAATIQSIFDSVLEKGVQMTFLAKDPAHTVTVPKVADQTVGDRAGRNFPGVKFTATMQGAIHTVQASGVLSV